MQQIIPLLKKSIKNWQDDNVMTWSAALSYYTIFALSPLLLLLLSITSLVIDPDIIKNDLYRQIQATIGREAATLITSLLTQAKERGGGVATFIGFILLFVGASGVFGQLKATLNHIFKVKPMPQNPIKGFFKQKLTGFLMIVAIGILLALSLSATALLSILGTFFTSLLPLPQLTFELINFIVSFLIISILFGLIYKILPDVKLPFSLLWRGSLLTAFLYTIGKTFLGLYLGSGAVGSSFGAASSLVIILVWIYYSSLIFFFGAELIRTYATAKRVELVPKEHAVSTLPIKREEETPPFIKQLLSYVLSGILLKLIGKILKRK